MSVLLDTAPARPRGLSYNRLNWIDPLIIVAIGAALRIAFFRGALGSDEIVYITQAKYLLHGQFDHSTYIGAIRYGIKAFQALSLWLFGSSRAGADGLFLACSLGDNLRPLGPRIYRNDGHVASNFIMQALHGQDVTLYGDGSQTRAFCCVDDMVEGLVRLMATGNTATRPINLPNA